MFTIILCFLTLIDCKTVCFFLKISREIGKVWRKSLTRAKRASLTGRVRRLSPVSLSVFSLVLDLLFDCSRVLEYAKIRTVLQSITLSTYSDSIVSAMITYEVQLAGRRYKLI